MSRGVERTDDGRWIVVDGRRWRIADPALPEDVRARLLHHLGVARAAVRTAGRAGDDAAVAAARARVHLAKTGLGERGPAWWEQDDDARRARWEAALVALEPGG
ncbi:biopolymer transporter Tol [Geodermatophilus sp. CPCC 206100]|uniref:biopolymer transporter Tol n=1 Tax=Geodermatophilus sp. CPCC 206100 TaxID=3020054 RepID=UPI003B00ED6C